MNQSQLNILSELENSKTLSHGSRHRASIQKGGFIVQNINRSLAALFSIRQPLVKTNNHKTKFNKHKHKYYNHKFVNKKKESPQHAAGCEKGSPTPAFFFLANCAHTLWMTAIMLFSCFNFSLRALFICKARPQPFRVSTSSQKHRRLSHDVPWHSALRVHPFLQLAVDWLLRSCSNTRRKMAWIQQEPGRG